MKADDREIESSSNPFLTTALASSAGAAIAARQVREVVEWAEFRAAPGVTVEQVIEASDDLHVTFLRRQPGFLRRELLRCDTGSWVDVVYWTDRTAAELAARNATKSDACARYIRCMADHKEAMVLFERMKGYSR